MKEKTESQSEIYDRSVIKVEAYDTFCPAFFGLIQINTETHYFLHFLFTVEVPQFHLYFNHIQKVFLICYQVFTQGTSYIPDIFFHI